MTISYSNHQGDVLLLAEHGDQEIDMLTLQLASKGRELADSWHCRLNAILIGHQLDLPTRQLLDKGFATVFVADHQLLEPYNAEIYANIISDFLKENMPSVFLLGYSYLGMELGPIIATRLGITLACNCVGVELSDGHIIVTRPMFGGIVHTKLEVKKLPIMISVQKGVLPVEPSDQRPANLMPIKNMPTSS